jgi:hypothetical protein
MVANNSPVVHAVALGTFDAAPLQGHTDIVLALAVSKDGRFVATGSKVCRVVSLLLALVRMTIIGLGQYCPRLDV